VFLQEYHRTAYDAKKENWNFPKAHLHEHLFDDIESKGVTANTSTKPNEKMHGPLKKWYQLHTNFKDVAKQVCFSFAITCGNFRSIFRFYELIIGVSCRR